MQVSGFLTMFLFGCAGGGLMELLRWWKLRESPNFPAYAGKPVYWLLTFAMIGAGGFVAAVYDGGPRHVIELINLGAAAPAIIGALAKEPSGGAGGKSRNFEGTSPVQRRIRQFLAFG